MEIEKFTRKRFSDDFDKEHNNGIQCISVPFQMFIDGFGPYRNSYRSIMGFYMVVGALTFQERTRRANVLPITLGPHGQNFDDVVDALQTLRPLEEGILMEVNGKKCLVCAFTLCYTGDMPQQQENAGFKTPGCDRHSEGRITFNAGMTCFEKPVTRSRSCTLPRG